RPRARLVPAVLAVAGAADAVVAIILATLAGCVPRRPRCLAVVGMDGVEPAEAQARRGIEPGEIDPLRARPGASAVGQATEHQLGDVGGKQPEPLLAVAYPHVSEMPVGAIAQDLDEALAGFLQRHQQA